MNHSLPFCGPMRAWLAALVLAWCGSAIAASPYTDGQAATLVLGAGNFTTAGGGASASRFEYPSDICIDATTGKVFVVVYGQNRILRFSSAQAATIGGAAEAVFGQPDFTSTTANNGGLSAKSLNAPMYCAMDSSGRLFVTDTMNLRVLRYDNAATKTDFAAADGVLGQADFTTRASATTASRFGPTTPTSLALGPNGDLYVNDPANKRVLRFNNAAGKSNGADADGVLGAANFTTVGASAISASSVSGALGLAVDAGGNLYVSDIDYRRILRFNNASTKNNGAPADGVLGAPDLQTGGSGTASRSNMSNSVWIINVLPDGALYVSDAGNHRVLIFDNPAQKPNGADADHVLGQSDFTSSSSGLSASKMNGPESLRYHAQTGYLLIADGSNNRILGFRPVNAGPTATGVTVTGTPQEGQPLTGSYTYTDTENDPEGMSTFQWKRGATAVGGATSLQYTPVAVDVGSVLTFCVTPVASTGTAAGVQACSAPSAAVAAAPVDGACGSAAGQPRAIAPAANLCSAGTPGPVSSAGSLYTWQCQGQSSGSPINCQAPWANAGSGSAMVVLTPTNGWQVDNATISATPPTGADALDGATFPAGVLALNLSSGTQGSDATVTLHFTSPIPAGAVYMKYGPSPDGFNCQGNACTQDHWYELPASRVAIAGDRLSATLTLTDGGLGDHDGAANQLIQDPGGFALLAAPAGAQAIPTLSEWGVLLLSALAAAFGLRAARRPRF